MNGLLNFYTSSRTESQKDGYKNHFCHSILQVNGDYIPAWYFEATGTTITCYFETINTDLLSNGTISVTSEVLGSYTPTEGAKYLSMDRTAYTLTELHRLKIDIDGTLYYSDVFMDINDNLPVQTFITQLNSLLLYSY
jgi:hypothetical protein